MANINGAALHVIPSHMKFGAHSERLTTSVVMIRSSVEAPQQMKKTVVRPFLDGHGIMRPGTIPHRIGLQCLPHTFLRPVAASLGAEYTADSVDNSTNIPPIESSPLDISSESLSDNVVAPSPGNDKSELSSLKLKLLALVAGLDRGLAAASSSETEAVEKAAAELEAAAAFAEEKSEGGFDTNWEDQLQGRWSLVYSSGFASTGSLGGRRPGPPAAVVPPLFKLGQVYQRIDVLAKELDNIVYFNVASPWPLPPLQVVATLAHSYEVEGDNNIRIIFEKTSLKFEGTNLISQVPPIELPQLPPDFLRPFQSLRSGTFQITLLDENMRITRGDRGELRVFVLV